MTPDRDDQCSRVDSYLQRFADSREGLDHEAVSDHVMLCSRCYDRMAEFFRVMDVPETEYLRETIDDLTFSIYNLAKALVKEPSREDGVDHENINFVSEPGRASEHLAEGTEVIDDVQDFTGEDEVRGESMEDLRELMNDSQAQFKLVQGLLQRAIDLGGQFSADCSNLKGILCLSENRLDEAEACFRAVIRQPAKDLEQRKVQVHAMNNLSYVHSAEGRVDEAIKWASRSKVLAEGTAIDPFGSRFGLMFFYLRRDDPGDIELAIGEVKDIFKDDLGRQEFARVMDLETNEEIRKLFDDRGLAARFKS